jgi:hypothetical protein
VRRDVGEVVEVVVRGGARNAGAGEVGVEEVVVGRLEGDAGRREGEGRERKGGSAEAADDGGGFGDVRGGGGEDGQDSGGGGNGAGEAITELGLLDEGVADLLREPLEKVKTNEGVTRKLRGRLVPEEAEGGNESGMANDGRRNPGEGAPGAGGEWLEEEGDGEVVAVESGAGAHRRNDLAVGGVGGKERLRQRDEEAVQLGGLAVPEKREGLRSDRREGKVGGEEVPLGLDGADGDLARERILGRKGEVEVSPQNSGDALGEAGGEVQQNKALVVDVAGKVEVDDEEVGVGRGDAGGSAHSDRVPAAGGTQLDGGEGEVDGEGGVEDRHDTGPVLHHLPKVAREGGDEDRVLLESAREEGVGAGLFGEELALLCEDDLVVGKLPGKLTELGGPQRQGGAVRRRGVEREPVGVP